MSSQLFVIKHNVLHIRKLIQLQALSHCGMSACYSTINSKNYYYYLCRYLLFPKLFVTFATEDIKNNRDRFGSIGILIK